MAHRPTVSPFLHGIHLIRSSPALTSSGVAILAFAMPCRAARRSREEAALQFGHLDQAAINKIARGNAIWLLGLDLPEN